MRTQCTYYSSPKCLAFPFSLKTKAISFPLILSLSLSLSLSFINAVLHYKYPILQQKFTIALLLKCKKKEKKTFAYFLVIDNADENTMHILQLPKVFGFSFLLKNQGHLFPALTHTHTHTLSLSIIPSYITSIQSCNKNYDSPVA